MEPCCRSSPAPSSNARQASPRPAGTIRAPARARPLRPSRKSNRASENTRSQKRMFARSRAVILFGAALWVLIAAVHPHPPVIAQTIGEKVAVNQERLEEALRRLGVLEL